MRRLLWAIPVFSILTFSAFAAEKSASIERMKSDLSYLAGEECEGRGVETAGIVKAGEYIAGKFKEFGLKPANKDSYFQPFSIRGTAKLDGPNTASLIGADGKPSELKMGEDYSVSGLTSKGEVKVGLVFAGYGITVEKPKVDPKADPKKAEPVVYDDYAGVDVAGKAVIVIRKTPRAGNTKEPFAPDADNYGPLTTKIETAEKHKAAAVIFVNDRDGAKDKDELMAFDYARGGGTGSVPVIHIHRALLEQLLDKQGLKLKEIEEKIDKDLKPQSVALNDWKIAIQTSVKRQEIKARNVIGVLEGSGTLADETIVIGAHYDHLGRGEPGSLSRGSKDIHWGADDNGSGTTGMIELARRISATKSENRRRILFMAYSGEERGLLGSVHYCKEPLFPLEKTTAMINLDMIGRLRDDEKTQKGNLEIGGIGSAKDFEAKTDKLNEKYGFNIKKTRSGVGPSDHTSFYQKNVPVFFFFTGLHSEYHRPTDKVDTINFDGMVKIVDMIEELATDLSTTKEKPVYVAGATSGGRGNRNRDGGGGPRLGIMPAEYDEDEAKGMPVGGVSPGGAAEKGGIKAGDWIIDIAGAPVKNVQGYMKAMASQKAGTEIEITVDRKGEKKKLKIKLD
jgi:hypothetical protein